MYERIEDLLFIGDAIDLPYYDFVVGIEQLNPSDGGVAFNHGEGEDFKRQLQSISRTAVVFLSHQPLPPKKALAGLVYQAGVKSMTAQLGLLHIDPAASSVQFIQTPDAMLNESEGVVEASPSTLLDMLSERLSAIDD